jgi:NhaP-type Na+/H+ or K+/H+ antiporter
MSDAVVALLPVLSPSQTLFQLGLIGVLAALAPLLAQVLHLPSILVLLALGFGAGATGVLDPTALLGENVVSAVVSIAVGIILFEAGLALNVRKLTGNARRAVVRLVSLGILVTWAVAAVAAFVLFHLSLEIALLLGALLVVSGPTVVGPLLSFIHPSKTVESVLKWEGTFADPIGATLGVLVFNAIVAGQARAGEEVAQFFLSIAIGVGFGLAGAALVLVGAAWFKPNQSQALSSTLMFVVAMVVGADLLREDTGLIAGLVMGMILVNRPRRLEPAGLAIESAKLTRAWRERIGTLSTFLIGTLFIILSADVSPHDIAAIGWVSLAFIAVLVLVGRPLAVALSTLGSTLRIRERTFIAWMAPRGIVAAATSSTFALGLSQAGVGGGTDKLVPITFIVIVGTALIYGLSGPAVARGLGVARTGPGDVLLLGATPVGRAIGRALQTQGLRVFMWATNDERAQAAQAEGLSVYQGDPAADAATSAPTELDGVTYALAIGDDDSLNAMIATDLSEYFGSEHVYQLPVRDRRRADFYTRGQTLFDGSANHDWLAARIAGGAEITILASPSLAGEADLRDRVGEGEVPMFVYSPGKHLHIVTAGDRLRLQVGQELIGLIDHGSPAHADPTPR